MLLSPLGGFSSKKFRLARWGEAVAADWRSKLQKSLWQSHCSMPKMFRYPGYKLKLNTSSRNTIIHLQFTSRFRFIGTETTFQPLSTVSWDNSLLEDTIISFTVTLGIQLIFTRGTVSQVTVDISRLHWIRIFYVAIILKRIIISLKSS